MKLSQLDPSQIRLGDIDGIHTTITELESSLSIPPLGHPDQRAFSKEDLRRFLKIYPIWLTESRSRYRCVGNVRLYRTAASIFDPDDTVPANLAVHRMKPQILEQNYLTELFLTPLIFGPSAEDTERLYQVWARLKEHPQFAVPLSIPSIAAFARSFRINRSRLKKS